MFGRFFNFGKIVLFCTLSVVFHGCSSKFIIDVKVNAHFFKNGSGSYAMVANFENLKGFFGLSSYNKREALSYDYIANIFTKMSARVQKKYEDNKVIFKNDSEKQEFEISFNFGSMDELNDIIKLMFDRQIIDYAYRTDRKTKQKKFVLTNQITSLKRFGLQDFIKDDDTKIKWFSINSMLSNIKIFRTYSFDENIKRVNTDKVKVYEDKKVAHISNNLWKLMNPQTPENKVHYVIAFK